MILPQQNVPLTVQLSLHELFALLQIGQYAAATTPDGEARLLICLEVLDGMPEHL